MKNSLFLALFCLFFACKTEPVSTKVGAEKVLEIVPTLVIHGGAGTITKANMTPADEAAYQSKMTEALNTGYAILEAGGTSLEAIEKTIMVLEDSPLFNAAKGAVFTNAGTNELDASVMDGSTLNAGAVAGIKTIKNPIQAAIKVMTNSPHVMLSGEGADIFAKGQGLETVGADYFHTDRRWNALQRIKAKELEKVGDLEDYPDWKYGTVGACALDQAGNLAAGTSTGGMTNKRWGRIGDSPVIGAGTYANNATCAVSSTGHGEFFIRNVVAYDVSAMMEYGSKSLEEASNYIINEKLKNKGGSGGIIALDAQGNISMPFNTEGMYRGYIKAKGAAKVLIYK